MDANKPITADNRRARASQRKQQRADALKAKDLQQAAQDAKRAKQRKQHLLRLAAQAARNPRPTRPTRFLAGVWLACVVLHLSGVAKNVSAFKGDGLARRNRWLKREFLTLVEES